MDVAERFPEERLGTAAMIRARAEEFEKVASACDAEAREQEHAAARLRARAERLRDLALEYRAAAHAAESPGPIPRSLSTER